MQSYFIAPNMKDMRYRVEAKNIDNLRRNIIKEFPKDKEWNVVVFDYYQNFLGHLFFDGVKEHPILWGHDGNWEARKVSTKTGRLL